jgi:prepilin-type N-terminal cleavage/methylation domain-containing protein
VRRTSQGFTLVEIMIVLLLTGMILFMVSQLTSRTFQSLRFLREKAQTLQSATLGLERLTSELREAVTVAGLSPLVFGKINPAAPEALANPVAELDPANNWSRDYGSDFNNDNQVGVVTYDLNAGNEILTRTATFNGNSMTSEVATSVNSFTVERGPTINSITTGANVFLVRLSLTEQRRVISFETVMTVPGLAP